jgi:hypothetical protein
MPLQMGLLAPTIPILRRLVRFTHSPLHGFARTLLPNRSNGRFEGAVTKASKSPEARKETLDRQHSMIVSGSRNPHQIVLRRSSSSRIMLEFKEIILCYFAR